MAKWKLLPEFLGGGLAYLFRYKDSWVRHNRRRIVQAAEGQKIPPPLLAGICWNEVGGDPHFVDMAAFMARSFDWSGPPVIDKYLTVLKNPIKTSFSPGSIQLGNAAETLGIDANKMSNLQTAFFAKCLQFDSFNIEVVARHLRILIDHDGFQKAGKALTKEEIRVVGARYNRGRSWSLEEIKKNTSYGDVILKRWDKFVILLK